MSLNWMMNYWIEALFGALFTGMIFGFRWLLKRQFATQKGVQALLRDRIIQAYNHYKDKGFYPIYARENVTALFLEYHALGGNGVIADLLDDLSELPTERKTERSEERKEERTTERKDEAK